MARDDFFLSFGTDANLFADKIETESARASQAILHLTEALEDYDGTVRNSKAGGPLQSLFGALDQAAGQFGRLTNELSNSLGSAIQGITGLKEELSGLVAAVNEVNIARERARGKGGPPRPPVLDVSDDEVVATDNARRSGRFLGEVIELNAREARNALKRVADINATVGRNSNSAADGLKELARQIRELSGAAKEAQGRGTIGQIAGTGGGITITGPVTFSGEGVGLAQIAPSAPVAQKAQGPVTDQQADAVVRAEAKRRRSDPIPIGDLSGVATPGLYSHPDVEGSARRRGGRLVGADVREGESFQDYFTRNDATRARIEASRASMPKAEHADLADFRQFKLSGGKVADQLEDKWMRALQQDKHSSAITAEGIKASLTDLGLEQQYPGLPQIIERILQTRAAQREHAEKAIRELLAEDPHTTFGGGALGVQNTDFEIGNTYGAALHKVDQDLIDSHEGHPATVAAAQARRDAAEKRRLFRFSSDDTAVPLSSLAPAPGTAEQEGMTVAARRKADAVARKAARDANAAFVATLDPIEQALIDERQKGNPELQRINATLAKKSLNVSEVAETLGLTATETRRPTNNEAALQRAALEREEARTRLEAFAADPEAATERMRQQLAAREATEVGLKGHLRNYPMLPTGPSGSRAAVTAANLTPERAEQLLHQQISNATRQITGLTTERDYPGLTDDSQAEARERLENRRQQILEETSRLHTPTATSVPASTFAPEQVARAQEIDAARRAQGLKFQQDREEELSRLPEWQREQILEKHRQASDPDYINGTHVGYGDLPRDQRLAKVEEDAQRARAAAQEAASARDERIAQGWAGNDFETKKGTGPNLALHAHELDTLAMRAEGRLSALQSAPSVEAGKEQGSTARDEAYEARGRQAHEFARNLPSNPEMLRLAEALNAHPVWGAAGRESGVPSMTPHEMMDPAKSVPVLRSILGESFKDISDKTLEHYAKAAGAYIQGQGVSGIQEGHADRRIDHPAEDLLRGLVASAPKVDHPLYRGVDLDMTKPLTVGQEIHLPPSSFTGDPEVVKHYADQRIYRTEGAQALDIGHLTAMDEFLAQGKFKVKNISTDPMGREIVDLEQIETGVKNHARSLKEIVEAETAAAAAIREAATKATHEQADANRTVYRGSNEPLDLDRIGPEGLRVTQERGYAEEHGGDQHLYKMQVPASHFPKSDFTDEEIPHAMLTREQIEALGGFEEIDTVANTAKGARKPRQKGRLAEARERLAELHAAENEADDALQGEIAALEQEIAKMSAARVPKAAAGGGGAGTPPRPPRNAAAASAPDPDDDLPHTTGFGDVNAPAKGRSRSRSAVFAGGFENQIKMLQASTQAVLADARARLVDTEAITNQTEKLAAQRRILVEAAAALKNDPHYSNFPGIETARGTLAQGLGLAPSKDNLATVRGLLGAKGSTDAVDAAGLNNKVTAAASAPSRVPGANEPGGTMSRALFGQRGFLDAQLRHIGLAIENFAGFQLVFTGFEKLKELVQTGLETDVTFVRLKATLDATGRSSNGLRTAFSRISAETGEDLKKVVEAGAELAGVFKNNADLVKGVEISAQLANISQGTLTAKDAAIGLRDVTDAYAVQGSQGIQQVGDQIARLSVVTGVSVKDITEGATQLAQEAHEFGLSQRQAVTLTAFVTKSTGESGEQAAEQTSRLLSTLTTTKVQDLLVRYNVATREQFAGGDIAGVVSNLVQKFDQLSPSARQAVQSLVGAGRQARAFTGLVRDGKEIVDEFNNSQNDMGTLARQNTAILGTVSGNIKQMGEEFRNMGQTLQQLGVFDILGVVAKSVQILMHEFNRLGQGLADIFNSNPILKHFKDLVAILLEAVVAFKILGPIATATMGRLGIGAAGRAAQVAAGVAPTVGGTTRSTATQFLAGRRVAPFIGPLQEEESRFLQRTSAPMHGPLLPGESRPIISTAGERVNAIRPFAPAGVIGRSIGGMAASAARSLEERNLGMVGSAAIRAANATGTLGRGLERLGNVMVATGTSSMRASIAAGAMNGAMMALGVAIPLIIKGFQDEGEIRTANKAGLADLMGTPGEDTDPAKKAEIETRKSAQRQPTYASAYKDFFTGGPSGTTGWQRFKNIIGRGDGGTGSGGITSDAFDRDEGRLQSQLFTKLREASTPEEIKAAQIEVQKLLADQSKNLVGEAGDDRAKSSAIADLETLKNALAKAGDNRLQTLQGLNAVDHLNVKNIEGLGVLAQTTAALNRQTLAQIGPLLQSVESDQGLAKGSQGDVNFQTTIDPKATTSARRQANIRNLQLALARGQDVLDTDIRYSVPGQAHDELQQKLLAQANQLQQLQTAEAQNAQGMNAVRSSFLATAGNPTAAADAMQASVQGILQVLAQVDESQPEFFQALTQLLEAEQKTAELAIQPQLDALHLHSSLTLNNVTKANDAAEAARLQLGAAKGAAEKANSEIITQAQTKYDAATGEVDRLSTARDSAPEGDAKFFNDSIKNAKLKQDAAAKELADAKARQVNIGKNPAVIAAQIAKNEADLQAAQAESDQFQSAFQLAATIMEATGDQAAADNAILVGLESKGGALDQAIKNYGTNSQQANAVRTQIIQQKQKLENDLLDVLNASLDLDIATLEARGQKGDAEKVAADRTQEAQNAVDSYKKRTGDTGLTHPEGQRLQAALVTSKRAQFDTALQAQLETLDFQKETYQITSNQEIQALQEILKNKQLTLKEQRDITLKIKNLQEQVRNQLTSSGFNIPTDIKLPTPYAVRRSLGLNPMDTRNTTATNYNVVNNTVLNNTVSSPAMVHAIAQKVVDLIGTQTATATRSNQTSPALVRY